MRARSTRHGERTGSAPYAKKDVRQPIRTAQEFTAAMLEGARELYQDEGLRQTIAKRIS